MTGAPLAGREVVHVPLDQLHGFLNANSMVARVVALNLHGLTKRLPKGYHLQKG